MAPPPLANPQEQVSHMSVFPGNYTLDQLVEIVTREVLAAYPPEGGHACNICNTTDCDGQCVQTNPAAIREVVSVGPIA